MAVCGVDAVDADPEDGPAVVDTGAEAGEAGAAAAGGELATAGVETAGA